MPVGLQKHVLTVCVQTCCNNCQWSGDVIHLVVSLQNLAEVINFNTSQEQKQPSYKRFDIIRQDFSFWTLNQPNETFYHFELVLYVSYTMDCLYAIQHLMCGIYSLLYSLSMVLLRSVFNLMQCAFVYVCVPCGLCVALYIGYLLYTRNLYIGIFIEFWLMQKKYDDQLTILNLVHFGKLFSS